MVEVYNAKGEGKGKIKFDQNDFRGSMPGDLLDMSTKIG